MRPHRLWRRKHVARAREAEYKQLDVLGEEWDGAQKPYDPYAQTDVRTPGAQDAFDHRSIRSSYMSGTTEAMSPGAQEAAFKKLGAGPEHEPEPEQELPKGVLKSPAEPLL